MSLDVRIDHLTTVQSILKQHIPDRRVLAFGSRVKGNARKVSDLDLCILGDAPLPLPVLSRLTEAFSVSNIPYKIDIVEWSQLTPSFQAIISEASIGIQGEGQTNKAVFPFSISNQ